MAHSSFVALRVHGEQADIVGARLPASAAKKLQLLRQSLEDAHALQNAVAEKRVEVQQERAEANTRLNYLLLPKASEGGGAFDDHPDVVAQRKLLEAAKRHLADIKAVYAPRAERTAQLGSLVDGIERYILGLRPDQKISAAKPVQPRLNKGEQVQSALEAKRRKILKLKTRLQAVEGAPYPSACAIALAQAEVARLAEVGKPDVTPLIENGCDLMWPKTHKTYPVIGADGAVVLPYVDAVATLAWLFPDAMAARVEAEIMARSNDEAALSAEERMELVRSLSAEILAEERMEEELTQLAEAQGVGVVRRAGANPCAVLGIEIE